MIHSGAPFYGTLIAPAGLRHRWSCSASARLSVCTCRPEKRCQHDRLRQGPGHDRRVLYVVAYGAGRLSAGMLLLPQRRTVRSSAKRAAAALETSPVNHAFDCILLKSAALLSLREQAVLVQA